MIPYDNSNLVSFLLNLNPDHIVEKYLYQTNLEGELQGAANFDLYQIDRYLLVKEEYKREQEQQLTTQTTIMELAIDQEI